ncbi:MAG: hypothetical protein M1836_007138 [Candelina mexicana]|nr:MAG: hypothetical protein M1836_007138 [Candelina mexicana]
MLSSYVFATLTCTFLFTGNAGSNPVKSSLSESMPVVASDVYPSEPPQPRALSISPLTPGIGVPWPNHLVRYCFKDVDTDRALNGLVVSAWNLWRNAGHINLLDIQKVGDCKTHINGYYPLRIVRNTNHILRTSLGAKPGPDDRDGNPVNYLRFDSTNVRNIGFQDNIINMAHELGHAFGLHHEHQRTDAHDHIRFVCENLEHYEEKKKKGEDMHDLCTSKMAADAAKFEAGDFIPLAQLVGLNQSQAYDPKSIMHYGTYFGSKSKHFWPKKKVLTDLKGKELAFQATKPSEMDIERINWLYR